MVQNHLLRTRLKRLARDLRPFDRRASYALELLAERGEVETILQLLLACRDGSIADALTAHVPRGDEAPSDLCQTLEDLMDHLNRMIRELEVSP